MKIAKVREVKTPTRANKDDAGIDFYVPEFTKEFIKDLNSKNNNNVSTFKDEDLNPLYIMLKPHERILIPSGIHVNFKDDANNYREQMRYHSTKIGLALIAHNKSGVGSKEGLDRLAEVVDESYQGEVHINIVNTGNETINIHPGKKLIQFVLEPVIYSDIEEYNIKALYKDSESTRGSGGFGSTDHK